MSLLSTPRSQKFNSLIVLLCWRPVLKFVHWITGASAWWFPWLDGEWRAELRSNWPKIEAMYDAARTRDRIYDPHFAPAISDDDEVTYASVLIKVTLLEISIEFTFDGTDKVSTTRFVRPRWAKPDRPEISYVYEQEAFASVAATDAPTHFGAGLLRYYAGEDELRGHYWTNRRWDLGLNTAGTIVMRRKA